MEPKMPELGHRVYHEDGTQGVVVQAVEEEVRWGGPWTVEIAYIWWDYINKTCSLHHEWVTAQEWGQHWTAEGGM